MARKLQIVRARKLHFRNTQEVSHKFILMIDDQVTETWRQDPNALVLHTKGYMNAVQSRDITSSIVGYSLSRSSFGVGFLVAESVIETWPPL